MLNDLLYPRRRQNPWNKLVSWLFDRGALRIVVGPEDNNDSLMTAATYCANGTRDKLRKFNSQQGIFRFLAEIRKVETVSGIAVLTCQEYPAPQTFLFEIFTPLDAPGDESIKETVRKVGSLSAEILGKYRQQSFLSSLYYVNTTGTSIAELEPECRKRWKSDPTSHLLALIEFRREPKEEGK